MNNRGVSELWCLMPHYALHLRNGELEADDEEGLDLPNERGARDQALVFARDLLAAAVLQGRLALQERIEVVEDGRGPILSLSFAEAVGLPE